MRISCFVYLLCGPKFPLIFPLTGEVRGGWSCYFVVDKSSGVGGEWCCLVNKSERNESPWAIQVLVPLPKKSDGVCCWTSLIFCIFIRISNSVPYSLFSEDTQQSEGLLRVFLYYRGVLAEQIFPAGECIRPRWRGWRKIVQNNRTVARKRRNMVNLHRNEIDSPGKWW